MRIRKNAKLTPSIIWSTAATAASPNPPEELMHSHVCVVNRSPWDVPSPPRRQARDYLPSVFQDDINLGNNDNMNSESGRRSLNEGYIPPPVPPSAAAVDDSCQLVDSMKLSSNYEHKSDLLLLNNNNNSNTNNNIGDSVKRSFLSSPPVPNGDEFPNGFWEEPRGETMVVDGWAHHPHLHPTEEGSPSGKLSSPHDLCSPAAAVATCAAAIERNDNDKNYSDQAAPAATVPPKRRGRPRKAPPAQQQQQQQAATAAANPYDYYYYAGFGPRWGKRRGVDKLADNSSSISPTTTTSNVVKRKNSILHPMSFRGGTSAVTGCFTAGGSTSSSSSYYRMELNDDDDDEPMADYIDDDDEDDDDDEFDGCSGAMDRKRVRKPIKARSLKSLIA